MGKVIETVADSIAIEILDKNTIISGKGNELHLFRRNDTAENVFESQVLPIKLPNKIHGIRKTSLQQNNQNFLLVYSEKHYVLAKFNDRYEFKECYSAHLSDWISNGCFINNGNAKEFVLLTAHSVIMRFSLDVENKICTLIEKVSCTDKSTLYCSHFYGTTWENLVVFAGNAFGELLIWQPIHNEEIKTALRPKVSHLIHRLAAHNGVVFSIDYDEFSQYLITTSDNRAIKWWKVNYKEDSKTEWHKITLQPKCSGYGHTARVFQGRIIRDGDNAFAITVGEDSNLCIWDSNAQLLFKRRQQFGATIWGFAYDYHTKTVYTVGSVGNVVAFGLSQVLKDTQLKNKDVWLLPWLLPSLGEGEYIAKVKFLSQHLLVGITNKNLLMLSKFKDGNWFEWQPIEHVEIDFKCTIMEVYKNRIAVCGDKRLILLEYLAEKDEFVVLYDKQLLKSVIRSFIFFNKYDYLICDNQGNCKLFMRALNVERSLQLPKSKEPWLTTALLLNQQEYLLISNRQGNLLLYQLNADSNKYYDLKHTLKHIHGNLGATNLDCLEETITMALVRSTGHDRALNYFSVNYKEGTIATCQRQIIPVAWVEHTERLYNNIDLYLGFNDNNFVIWCKEYDFLLELPCGGGHRCWHFIMNSEDNNISFAFIKNKRVRYQRTPILNKELTFSPLVKRWHIAPCNTMQILSTGNTQNPTIVVTAADDNLIKIHTYTEKGLVEQQELYRHISSVRALKLMSLNKQEFLIFSGGGRAQLCVTKVNKMNFRVNELVNYTLKPLSEQDMTESNNSKPYKFNPETRLMSLDAKQLNEQEYSIYVGCSDGYVRLLHLNLASLQVLLIKEYFYNKCILQVRFIAELDYILVAATDGYLNFFDSQLENCIYRIQHHSSGINGLAHLFNAETNSLLILSGGDDQAVSYTELSISNSGFKILKQFHKTSLHTAQVCACAIMSNGLYGFTSGVDQILNKIDLTTGEIVYSFTSCVADIKGMALINNGTCLLYGCGLQIYDF